MAEPQILKTLEGRTVPRGVIVFSGVPYPVLSVVDLKYRAVVDLIALDSPADGASGMIEHFGRLGEQIRIMCPTMTDTALEDMTYRDRVAFYGAAIQASPPPLLDALVNLLDGRTDFHADVCVEACEHPVDCQALRGLWAVKDTLTEAVGPLAPQEAPPEVSQVSTPSTMT
jgi:hypothetical protein